MGANEVSVYAGNNYQLLPLYNIYTFIVIIFRTQTKDTKYIAIVCHGLYMLCLDHDLALQLPDYK